MITEKQMHTFADALDAEYANEIKPLLVKAHNAIDEVLNLIYSPKHTEKEVRNNFSCFKFGHLDEKIKSILGSHGYREDNCHDYRIASYGIRDTIVGYIGYSENYDRKLWEILCSVSEFHDNSGNVKRVETITNLKKRFNEIKEDFNTFFTENEGALFRQFVETIRAAYESVEAADRRKDEELYALFGNGEKPKSLKITIIIEGE